MQVDQVSPPVVVEHPRELWQIRIEQFFRGPGVASRRVIVGKPASPRRPLHILAHRQVLHCTDRESNDDRKEGDAEPPNDHRARQLHTVHGREGEEEGVCAGGEQHVLEQLRVRADDAQPYDQRKGTPAPILPVSYTAAEKKQSQRKERADKQFSVVSGRDRRCDLPAHHVGDTAHQ